MRLTSCVGRRPGRRRGRRGWLEWLEMLPFLRHASAGKQNKRACVTGSLQEPSRELRTAHILGTNGLMTRLQASQDSDDSQRHVCSLNSPAGRSLRSHKPDTRPALIQSPVIGLNPLIPPPPY